MQVDEVRDVPACLRAASADSERLHPEGAPGAPGRMVSLRLVGEALFEASTVDSPAELLVAAGDQPVVEHVHVPEDG